LLPMMSSPMSATSSVGPERVKFLRETMITFIRCYGIYMKQMWKASRAELLKFIASKALLDDYNLFVKQLVSFRQVSTSAGDAAEPLRALRGIPELKMKVRNIQRTLLAAEQKIFKLEDVVVKERRRRALAESMHEGAIGSLRTEEFAHGQTKMWLAHSQDHLSQIQQRAVPFRDPTSSFAPVHQVPIHLCHPVPVRPFHIPFVTSSMFSRVAPHAPLPPNFSKKDP